MSMAHSHERVCSQCRAKLEAEWLADHRRNVRASYEENIAKYEALIALAKSGDWPAVLSRVNYMLSPDWRRTSPAKRAGWILKDMEDNLSHVREQMRLDLARDLSDPGLRMYADREISQRIAAAPDLLVALRFAVARVEIANDEGDPILSAWLPDARAAIAKAEGRPE